MVVMIKLTQLREAIVTVGRQLAAKGLISGADGNISVRLEDGRILVTPSGARKGELTTEAIVLTDAEGLNYEGENRPSSEILMHLAVYKNRKDINACVHSHAPFSTALAVAGIEPDEDILPEVVLSVGRIALTAYAQPGTDEVPISLEPFLAERNAFLLKNHGLLTIGSSLKEAFNRHEVVEHFAQIFYYGKQLGNIDHIPPEQFAALQSIRENARSAGKL